MKQTAPILMLEGMYCPIRQKRLEWTKETLWPLLFHVGESGATSPFFSKFLLAPLQSSKGRYISGVASGYAPAQQADWDEWLETLLNPKGWVYALATIARKRQLSSIEIWIRLPYPWSWMTDGDGEQSKEAAQPSSSDHERQTRLEQWLTRLLEGWSQAAFLQVLTLRGFVWGREGIPAGDQALITSMNEWIHQRGFESFWLANYGAAYVLEAEQMGFDQVALSSPYTGHTTYTQEWLTNTRYFAQAYTMGLQIINGKGPRFDEAHRKHYLQAAREYQASGGGGCLVYRFPNHSLLSLFIEDRAVYHDIFQSLEERGGG